MSKNIGIDILAKIGSCLLNVTTANGYTAMNLNSDTVKEIEVEFEDWNGKELATYSLSYEQDKEIGSSRGILDNELLANIDFYKKITDNTTVSRMTEKMIYDLKAFVYQFKSFRPDTLNFKSVSNQYHTIDKWGVVGNIDRNMDFGQKKIGVGITINILFKQFPEQL